MSRTPTSPPNPPNAPLLVSQTVARQMLGLGYSRFQKLKRAGAFEIVQIDGGFDLVTRASIMRLSTPTSIAA